MKTSTYAAAVAGCLLGAAGSAHAWGVAGHQIVATIAQIHLHPSTRAAVANILPDWTNGQLAKIAAWPDRVRFQYPWSGQLHYINLINPEHPPGNCGWPGQANTEHNVLNAIQNYTARVARDRDDIDLRFLVHYIGDVHQPLHLTGRNKGGNGDQIIFEGRHMSMHGLWDTQLIAKYIREQRNYTQPLPSQQIESALTGSIYDPYVRWIVWEGIREWWFHDLPGWLACPPAGDIGGGSDAGSQIPFGSTAGRLQGALTADDVVCPNAWAEEPHSFCCKYIYPADFDDEDKPKPRELGTAEYVGKIKNDKVVESLLAKAGIRLAAVLNTILADQAELSIYGLVNFHGQISNGYH